jgi:hypothetical protein
MKVCNFPMTEISTNSESGLLSTVKFCKTGKRRMPLATTHLPLKENRLFSFLTRFLLHRINDEISLQQLVSVNLTYIIILFQLSRLSLCVYFKVLLPFSCVY